MSVPSRRARRNVPRPLVGHAATAGVRGAGAGGDRQPDGERETAQESAPHRLPALALAALGVVYGDIGTSPLYAFRECFNPAHGLQPTPEAVHGVLSLIVWSLVLVVSVKYIGVILRLDNRGEGGILALLALILQVRRRAVFVMVGLFGAALLYGDGVITPSISVLSAMEGLEVATSKLAPFILPLTLLVLFVLFLLQKRGTARVGRIFGPIMALWFVTIAALGVVQVVRMPAVLGALNPWWAVRFFVEHGAIGFLVLGAVVLAVTGAEALYADLGHFGRSPIRTAWFAVVLPALVLNYLGQGALLLADPSAVSNPFYVLAPSVLLYPLVVLATVATVIASQALISGVFSLTQQSIQLRYSPRFTIVHTSRSERGQVYMPEINYVLMLGCILLVLAFRSSSRLAAAYGVAVTGTMAITTILFYIVARYRWRWSALRAGLVAGIFLVVDLAFLGANVLKIQRGGWVPIAIAAGIFLGMSTWNRGTTLLTQRLASIAVPLDRFIEEWVVRARPPRVPGTAVFLTANVHGAPPLLILHLTHNKALHEEVVVLSVVTEEVPEVDADDRLEVEALPQGFHQVRARYGFMEVPNIEEVVARCCGLGIRGARDRTTYYLGRSRILPTGPAPMMRWRKHLFAFMARNATPATDFFGLPPDRVIELGARIQF